MDKAAAIQKIRTQLTEGDIEAALDLLLRELEPKRKDLRSITNRALQAKAQLEKTQQDELQGVISFENSKLSYNQITQQVIRLVDEWEDPTLAPPPQLPAGTRKITPKMWMVAGALIAFIGIIVWQTILKGSRNATEETPTAVIHADEICPDLDAAAFSIMVLPYTDLRDPNADDSPHRPLARRLDRYKGEYSGQAKTIVFSKDAPVPDTDQDAIRAGEECLAKLAIWGEYEHIGSSGGNTIITTNYKYLSSADNFEFTKLNLDEASEVEGARNSSSIPTRGTYTDTIQSYSEIINKDAITGELENQFRLLFGVAVMQSGDSKGAIELLEKTETKDSSSVLLKEMALAESYMEEGDKEKAVAAYDRVLATHPNYWFATNNRAMIYYEKGEYDKTLEALDQKLAQDPESVEALTIRGSVRLKTSQLKEAEEDLTKAERLSREPDKQVDTEQKKYIRKKIEVLENRKSEERKRISVANNQLTQNANNVDALTEIAEARRNLGDYTVAKDLASRILNLDKNNIKALAIKLESAEKTNDRSQLNAITREVKRDTAKQTLILEERPILRTILQPRIIQ